MKTTTITPPPDDPDPARRWEVWYSDTFDRETPAKVEVTGVGIVPGYVELWARFLFEGVQIGSRHDGTAVRQVAVAGFSDFSLDFVDGPAPRTVRITGDLAHALRLKRWIFGDVTSTTRGYLEEANLERLMHVARTHIRLADSATAIAECVRGVGG